MIDHNYDTDRFIWTADAAYEVTRVTFLRSEIENTRIHTTLMLKKVPSGTEISSCSDLLSEAVNLKTGVVASAVLAATQNSTVSDLQFVIGDSLALNFTNTITEYDGCVN
jgi:hypothetical protein